MASATSSEILNFIDTNFEALCKDRIDPWYKFSEQSFVIHCHDGASLDYKNTAYNGKPRDDFWNGYINPWLLDLCEQVIILSTKGADINDLNERLRKTEILLFDAVNKVFEQMTQVDQKLLTEAGHKNIKRRSIDAEESVVTDWISNRIAELKPLTNQRSSAWPAKRMMLRIALIVCILILAASLIGALFS